MGFIDQVKNAYDRIEDGLKDSVDQSVDLAKDPFGPIQDNQELFKPWEWWSWSEIESAVDGAFNPHKREPVIRDINQETGVLLNKQSNVSPIPVVYGRRKIGGTIVFKDTSGTDKEYLHIVLALCEGEIQAIDNVLIDDIDSTDTRFTGYLDVAKYYGTAAQTADPTLTAAFPTKWTSDHKLTGVAYVAIRFKVNRNLFGRQPRINCIVRGKKVYDSRITTTQYSANPALCIWDYLTNSIYGRGLATADLNQASFEAAADKCEGLMQKHTDTAVDSGTATSGNGFTMTDTSQTWTVDEYVGYGISIVSSNGWTQARTIASNTATTITISPIWDLRAFNYTVTYSIFESTAMETQFECHAYVQTERTLKENLDDLLLTCRGQRPFIQGEYHLIIEDYDESVMSFNEDNIVGDQPILIQGPNKRIKYNSIEAQFINPENNWQSDIAYQDSATFLSEDNGYKLDGKVTLLHENSYSRALHRAEYLLKKSRETISVNFLSFMEALELIPGDVISLSQDSMGWTNKLFRVYGLQLLASGNVAIGAIEYENAIYDRTVDAEQTPPDNTTLPDPFSVEAPTNFMADSAETYVINQNGTLITRVRLTWNPSSDLFVIYYQVEFKKSADSTWLPAAIGTGQASTEVFINNVEDGINYDFRINAVNNQGAESGYALISGHTIVGKTTPPGDVDSLTVVRQADGTRQYTWTYASPPLDLRGFIIKYQSGTGGTWATATLLPGAEELPGGVRAHESNQLIAGTYTFLIKPIDLNGTEATNATSTEVTLGPPRLGTSIASEDAASLNWPGTLTQARNYDNIIYAQDQDTWADWTTANSKTWGDLTNGWINNPYLSGVVYTHTTIDAGSDADYVLNITYTTNATTILVEERHSDDDITYTSWATHTGSTINARYFDVRITLSIGSGIIQLSTFNIDVVQA